MLKARLTWRPRIRAPRTCDSLRSFRFLKLTLQRNPDSFRDYVPTTPLREIELPNIASAKKNMRKSRAAMARNRAQRSALRTALKKGHSPEVDAAERLTAVSLLDRAARKGLIHPNAAARHKSRMAKKAAKK